MFINVLIILLFVSFLWALWSLKSEIKRHKNKHQKVKENIIFSMYKNRGA